MSTDRLIDEHRKSIAQLAQDGDGGSEVDLGALSGVTLSRRHTLSQAEYKDGMVCHPTSIVTTTRRLYNSLGRG